MRKRRVSVAAYVARRSALSLLLVGPAGLPAGTTLAAEKAPVLHVADSSPDLAEVQLEQHEGKRSGVDAKAATDDRMGEPKTVPSPAARLAAAHDGWVARDAIGKQVPLVDPVAPAPRNAPGPSTAVDDPLSETRPEATRSQPPVDAGPETRESGSAATSDGDALQHEPSTANSRHQASDVDLGWAADAPDEAAETQTGEMAAARGTISLKNLTPVPLMEPEVEPTAERSGDAAQDATEAGSVEGPISLSSPASSDEAEEVEFGSPKTSRREATDIAARTRESPEVAEPSAPMVARQRRTMPIRRPTIEGNAKSSPSVDRDDETSSRRVHSAAPDIGERHEEELDVEQPAQTPTSDYGDAHDVDAEVRTEPVEIRGESSGNEQQRPPVISAAVAQLQRPIAQCLQYYYQRPENAAERSSWGMMHSIMAFGVDTQVTAGRNRYNAIAWLAGNNVCRGKRLLAVDRYGIAPRQGVGLQGHQGQLLAVLALVGVPRDYPLYVDRQKFTVDDLIAHEQRECRAGAELTFTLIALAHYIDTDSQWRSKDGELWDFERLIQEELAQPVVGAACGGTHRLMGFSHALRIRREEGLPLSGQWARADSFIKDFTDYAWSLQNRDGSMSTDWFEGRADNRDVDRKIQTTGHIVEWMLVHTPDDQLQDERLVRAVRFLTSAMSTNPGREKEVGPKGHALRSLAIYYRRVFGEPYPWDLQQARHRGSGAGSRGTPSYR